MSLYRTSTFRLTAFFSSFLSLSLSLIFLLDDTPVNVYAEYLEYLPLYSFSSSSSSARPHQDQGDEEARLGCSEDSPLRTGVHHIALYWEIGDQFLKSSSLRRERELVKGGLPSQQERELPNEKKKQIDDRDRRQEEEGCIVDSSGDPEREKMQSYATNRDDDDPWSRRRGGKRDREGLVQSGEPLERSFASRDVVEALDAARCIPTAVVLLYSILPPPSSSVPR